MGLFSGWTKILRGLKHAVEAPLLAPFKDKADELRSIPEFQMFLDSPLGSPIESRTKKIMADSILGNMRDLLPKGKYGTALANVWGSTIADKASRIMDKKKLKEHFKKGWISVDEYADRRATQIQANLVVRLKRPIMDSRAFLEEVGFKETLDKVDRFLKPITDKIGKALKPVGKYVGEKSKQLLEKGIVTYQKGVAEVKRVSKEIKENIIDSVVEKAAEVVKTTVTTVVDFAKKTTSSVKAGFKKAWNWFKSKI